MGEVADVGLIDPGLALKSGAADAYNRWRFLASFIFDVIPASSEKDPRLLCGEMLKEKGAPWAESSEEFKLVLGWRRGDGPEFELLPVSSML